MGFLLRRIIEDFFIAKGAKFYRKGRRGLLWICVTQRALSFIVDFFNAKGAEVYRKGRRGLSWICLTQRALSFIAKGAEGFAESSFLFFFLCSYQ